MTSQFALRTGMANKSQERGRGQNNGVKATHLPESPQNGKLCNV